MPDFCYYAAGMQTLASTARYVYRVDSLDDTIAAYERLGFERVLAWDRDDARAALFRAGPALVEVVETPAVEPPPRRA
jgi:hypothetical protein